MTLDLIALTRLRTSLQVALEAEAGDILTVSNDRIPRDTDTAMASGRVVSDTTTGTVVITYGSDTDSNPKSHTPSNAYIEALTRIARRITRMDRRSFSNGRRTKRRAESWRGLRRRVRL